jgi:hypothetical protein
MRRTLPILVVLILAASAASAASAAAAHHTGISGKWTLSVDSPHGKVSMDLILKQDGKKITGTLSHGRAADIPLQGEFAGGALTFTTAAQEELETMEFRGRVGDDGSLTGYFSSSRGDMKVAGKRAGAAEK